MLWFFARTGWVNTAVIAAMMAMPVAVAASLLLAG